MAAQPDEPCLTPDAATPDPRTTLARPDLAEQALEGLVRARAYRPVRPMHAAVPLADIHAAADPASERIDQLIFGEAFDVLDQKGDRLWGRARRDGLVGWISASALQPGARLPTHRVAAVAAAGSTATRIAGCSAPAMLTCAVPSTCDSRGTTTLSAAS